MNGLDHIVADCMSRMGRKEGSIMKNDDKDYLEAKICGIKEGLLDGLVGVTNERGTG